MSAPKHVISVPESRLLGSLFWGSDLEGAQTASSRQGPNQRCFATRPWSGLESRQKQLQSYMQSPSAQFLHHQRTG